MILRKTDTSKTVTTANTWQTAINLSTISDFNRFLQTPADPYPIRPFDGTNKIARYRLVPFEQRLEYKDTPNTAVYDDANKLLFIKGSVPHPARCTFATYGRVPTSMLTPVRFGRSPRGHTSSFRFSQSASIREESITTTSMRDNRALAELTVPIRRSSISPTNFASRNRAVIKVDENRKTISDSREPASRRLTATACVW
jgi:hypothetical protein